MDVVTQKQMAATEKQKQGMWADLRDLLIRLEEMDTSAPEGSAAQLGEQDLADLWISVAWLSGRVDHAFQAQESGRMHE